MAASILIAELDSLQHLRVKLEGWTALAADPLKCRIQVVVVLLAASANRLVKGVMHLQPTQSPLST